MKLELDPGNPYAGEPIIPGPKYVEQLKELAALVPSGEISAREVARGAVLGGMLLIGTVKSKPVHYPVDIKEHRHYDIRDGGKHKEHRLRREAYLPLPAHQKYLRAGMQADIAIMCGLFGDYNSREERMQTCAPFTGHNDHNFGWGNDAHAERSSSWRKAYYAQEISPVGLFARGELINAAYEDRLQGSIDCIYDHPQFSRTALDVAQFIGPVTAQTIFSIPLRGPDLPTKVIASPFDTMDNLAM